MPNYSNQHNFQSLAVIYYFHSNLNSPSLPQPLPHPQPHPQPHPHSSSSLLLLFQLPVFSYIVQHLLDHSELFFQDVRCRNLGMTIFDFPDFRIQ